MFESLTEKITQTIKKISGQAIITEDNIEQITRDLRLALLESDVNYKVVKEFVAKVKEKALGLKTRASLNASEEFIKIVKEELLELLGTTKSDLEVSKKLTTLMLVGLQGSGKTTTIMKLALYLQRKHNKRPLIIAADIYRMAAITQLQELGESNNVKVFSKDSRDVIEIVNSGMEYARLNNYDYVLIDTAGRLHIDEVLMTELVKINETIKLDEILLVLDSLMGQDAINVITKFNDTLPLTGSILTKLDGSSKAGVALSLRYLTNTPIKFITTGEKMDYIEEFIPERLVGRILGDGDILSLVEQVESKISKEDTEDLEKKFRKGNFDLEDFLIQMKQIKKLGPLENLLKLLPGASKLGLNNVNIDPKQIAHVEAIVLSMTKKERRNPNILKASHKIRIAKGSGTSVQEVNKLLTQFEQMKKMMKMMKNGNFKMPF